MLKFILDHNVPKSVGVFLVKSGYSVEWTKNIDSEISDIDLLQLAIRQKSILITNDKDFLAFSNFYTETGIILFDFLDQSGQIRIDALKKILPDLKWPLGLIVLQ